jgi:hypothetical protein
MWLTSVVLEHNGDGAVNRVDEDTTTFGYRDHSCILVIMSMWADPASSDRNITWTQRFRFGRRVVTRTVVH